jgi:hypothetical protein
MGLWSQFFRRRRGCGISRILVLVGREDPDVPILHGKLNRMTPKMTRRSVDREGAYSATFIRFRDNQFVFRSLSCYAPRFASSEDYRTKICLS